MMEFFIRAMIDSMRIGIANAEREIDYTRKSHKLQSEIYRKRYEEELVLCGSASVQ